MYKTLIVQNDEYEDQRCVTAVHCDPKEEALYAEFWNNEGGKPTYETLELAVDLEEIIKIRDFLNGKIEAIRRRATNV